MTRRFRTSPAKPGQIKAQWGRADRHSKPSLVYLWGGEGASQGDARIIAYAIEDKRFAPTFEGGYREEPSLVEELERRGYDPTTLKISIERKKQ